MDNNESITPRTQEEIYELCAEELGVSVQKFRFFKNQLWSAVRYYLKNPHLTTGTILLNQFIKFIPNMKYVKKRLLYDFPAQDIEDKRIIAFTLLKAVKANYVNPLVGRKGYVPKEDKD